jgi:hypothetical protein
LFKEKNIMKYIFGLGLPRTCTNSLGSALHLLGINGECKCILNDFKNKREIDNGSKDYKYIIYNDAYQDLDMLLSSDKIRNNKYIITSRNGNDWKQSIQNFEEDKRELVSDLLDIDMNEYIAEVKEYFHDNQCIENLLVIDIFTEDRASLWGKLFEFLDIPIDEDLLECPFPKINLNEERKFEEKSQRNA